MFCTDSLEDKAVLLAMLVAQWVPAKYIRVYI